MKRLIVVFLLSFAGLLHAQTTCSTTIAGPACAGGKGAVCVNLAWTASISTGVAGYNLYRGTATNAENLTTPINGATPVTGTTYQDNSVVPGNSYYYEATSVIPGGLESTVSKETCAQAPTPPAPPTNFGSSPQ